MIYLTDPNNPTGLGIPGGRRRDAIAAAAPHALVLVDEAYADFSGRTLIGPLLDRQRNVIIGRTFAKAHGLAALRVGALVAHPDTLEPAAADRCCPSASTSARLPRSTPRSTTAAYLDWYVAESARVARADLRRSAAATG